MKQETKGRSIEVLFKWIMFTAAITGMAMDYMISVKDVSKMAKND